MATQEFPTTVTVRIRDRVMTDDPAFTTADAVRDLVSRVQAALASESETCEVIASEAVKTCTACGKPLDRAHIDNGD